MLRYLGIDLAWKVDPPKEQGTGYCAIDEDGRVIELGLITTDEEVLALAADETWIGIDASLVVPSQGGTRRCERLLRQRGMRILPTNLEFYQRHYGGCRGAGLAQRLRAQGFEYFGSGRNALFEVYPHAVQIVVNAGSGAAYKKGGRAARREASEQLLRHILEWEPSLQLPPRFLHPLVEGKGAADRMDAFMAAVLLYRHGISSGTLSEVIGDDDDGYILLPRGVDRFDR